MVATLGDFVIFFGETLRGATKLLRRRSIFLGQCQFIGVSSMGVLTVAAGFLGAVLGYQLYVSFHYFGAEALMGGTVGIALFRELGPVMAAIVISGRAGAAIAAEIASMRISEQIDALDVMAVDPFEYLVAPRVVAGLVMVPLTSVAFGYIALLSSGFIACNVMGLDWAVFWKEFAIRADFTDIYHCLIKGATFGLLLTWIGCYCGFTAKGGARGVGYATRTTVVASCLVILLSDYLLTSFLPFGFKDLKI